MKNKYDKSEGISPAQAAKLLSCRVKDLGKFKLRKLFPRSPFKAPGSINSYLKSEVLGLLEHKRD